MFLLELSRESSKMTVKWSLGRKVAKLIMNALLSNQMRLSEAI